MSEKEDDLHRRWFRDPTPGVPQEIPEDPSTQPVEMRVMDEETFMTECCLRLNAFLYSAPEEAQHLLLTFLRYEHELLDAHLREHFDKETEPAIGVIVGALFAGILQTNHGDGFYLRPILRKNPSRTGHMYIARFEVIRQPSEAEDRQ